MLIDSPHETGLGRLRRIWKESFGDDDSFLNDFERTAYSPERCRCAYIDGEPAAALYWFDCGYRGARIAYIYAAATAPEHRGRGIFPELMQDTGRHLAKSGYEGIILVPGSESLFDYYKRLGFVTSCYASEICCTASEEKTPLRRLRGDEYAELRRRLLPEGSVIQEGENLRFLETQAELYAGEGVLLAAREEDELLIGAELLGDTSALGRILNSLGYKRGRFRCVGEDIPFAMYRPVGDGRLPAPGYFGLAFD